MKNPEREKREAAARVEFIKMFPTLAPLLYSIRFQKGCNQPITVEQWLGCIQHELEHAKAAVRLNQMEWPWSLLEGRAGGIGPDDYVVLHTTPRDCKP